MMPDPKTTEAEIRALAERLRSMARFAAEASNFLAEDKTRRNRAAGETDSLYRGLEPEQTTEWKAAEALSLLSQEKAELERRRDHMRQQMSETLGTLHNINYEASMIRQWHADPNCKVPERAKHIEELRLEAHKRLVDASRQSGGQRGER